MQPQSAEMTAIAARLDRLSITSAHRAVLVATAIAYFFELCDLNTFSFASVGAVTYWNIPTNFVAVIIAALFAGMFVGAAASGYLAERYGRRPILLGATVVYGLASLGSAVSWNPESLALCRFVTGVGLGGIAISNTVFLAELVPARVRGKFTAIAFAIGVLGVPATAAVARLVVPLAPWGWRLVFVWGAIGILDAWLIARLRESPRWLAAAGRMDEAEQKVSRLETIALAEHGALDPPVPSPLSFEVRRAPFSELFRQGYRGRVILFCSFWTLQTFGIYGYSAWAPLLLLKEGVSVVHSLTYATLTTIASPLGAALAILLSERIRRKWLVAVVAALIAISAASYGATLMPVAIVAFGFVTSCLLQFFAAILYIYTPENFPTGLRSSGMGITYGAGRLANVVGPFVVGAVYSNLGYASVFVFIAGCWGLLAVLAALFGPARPATPAATGSVATSAGRQAGAPAG